MSRTTTEEHTIYTIDELKELDSAIVGTGYWSGYSSAYEKALDKLRTWSLDYGWWETELENGIYDEVQRRWGITFNPKDVTFDLDRGDYLTFGKTSDIDDKVFLKAAGVDLRTRAARAIYEDGGNLVIGLRYYGGGSRNWIGFYEYEYLPDYIEDMQPGIREKLDEALRDATEFALKVLKDEEESLSSEEYLVEWAQINEYEFDEEGNPA